MPELTQVLLTLPSSSFARAKTVKRGPASQVFPLNSITTSVNKLCPIFSSTSSSTHLHVDTTRARGRQERPEEHLLPDSRHCHEKPPGSKREGTSSYDCRAGRSGDRQQEMRGSLEKTAGCSVVLLPRALSATTTSHRARPEPRRVFLRKRSKKQQQKTPPKMIFRLDSVRFTPLILPQFLLQRQSEQNPHYLEQF